MASIKVFKSYDRAIIADEGTKTYRLVPSSEVKAIIGNRKHILRYRETLYTAIDDLVSFGYRKEN